MEQENKPESFDNNQNNNPNPEPIQQAPAEQPIQGQEKFIFYKTSWFLITMVLIMVSLLFGFTMGDGSMPGEIVMIGFGINLIILLAATISIFRHLKFFSMKVVAFIGFFLITLTLDTGASFAGSYLQTLPHKIDMAKNDAVLNKEYNTWKNSLNSKIKTSYSTDLGVNPANKIGLYKSVSDGKILYNFLTSSSEIKSIDSSIDGTPVYTNFNDALAISKDNDVEVFDYSLGKKLLINLQVEEGQKLSEGAFSDDSVYYQAKIEYTGTVGQRASSPRSAYVIFNMTDETFKLADNSEIKTSKQQTVSPRSVDAGNLGYDSCLGMMHGQSPYTEQLKNDFGYHYDDIYNTRSGGEKAVTVSDDQYYYFTALNQAENTAIFKMGKGKNDCQITSVLIPEKSDLSAGKIRSISFLNDTQIIFSINPVNSKNLEIYTYDLSSRAIKKAGTIPNTEIFELVNNSFLVAKESALKTPDTTSKNITGWKTFTGSDYNVQYKSTWIPYNNELAAREYWYETQTKKDDGGQYLVGISVDKTTSTLEQITSGNIKGIETEDGFMAESTSVTIGGYQANKIVTKYNGKTTDKNTSYLIVKDGYLISIYPYQISNEDLESMISSLKLTK